MAILYFFIIKDKKRNVRNLGVSWNKAIYVVVDLFENKASVHEGEAALNINRKNSI